LEAAVFAFNSAFAQRRHRTATLTYPRRTMSRANNSSFANPPMLRQRISGAPSSRPTTREVFASPLPSSAEQEFLERQFFDRVILPNGTFKTTNARRLDDLNQAVLPYLPQIAGGALKIMDVSVSSGVSTLEWHDFLSQKGIRVEMVGTDLTVYTSLISVGPQLAAVIDRDRNILHLDAFGRGLPPRGKGLSGFAAGMVRMLFEASMMIDKNLPPLQGRVREAAKGRILKCEPVTLLTRGFSERESLQVFEDDLLAEERPEFQNAFHVLRAANILNHAYFPKEVLARIARKLRMRLKPNGVLIVCRTTNEAKNNATIFEAPAGAGLRVLSRLGAGSEVEELLLGL
jgi:hypothetical protein